MEWFNKFKVGQKVKVTKITLRWNYGSLVMWNSDRLSDKNMDVTVGKVYKILDINTDLGYLLDTTSEVGMPFWYPVESLRGLVGEQLVFAFMQR